MARVIVTGVFPSEVRGAPRVRAFLDHLANAYAGEEASPLEPRARRSE
jgi:hypothetical protein